MSQVQDKGRREFLVQLAAGSVAATGVCALGNGCGVDPAPTVKAAGVDRAGQVKFAPGSFKQLATIGGAALLESPGVAVPILVIRTGEDEYKATSGLCTHVQCPVGYDKRGGFIECPCHGARFALDGAVLRKPATAKLTAFPVRTDPVSGEIVVDTNGDQVPALDENNQVIFPVDQFAELTKPNGTFAFTPIGMADPILVLRYESLRVFAYDAYSTAARCIVEYSPERSRIKCPCSGSEYELDGSIGNGPAKVPLKRYTTAFDGSTITITIA